MAYSSLPRFTLEAVMNLFECIDYADLCNFWLSFGVCFLIHLPVLIVRLRRAREDY